MARYFSPESDPKLFFCSCGEAACPAPPISPDLVERLDTLRARFGRPIRITSGPRCEGYNAKIGGRQNSAHLTGDAADIVCEGSMDRWLLIHAILSWGTGELFCRIGIGTDFIHLDVSDHHAPRVIWTYPG